MPITTEHYMLEATFSKISQGDVYCLVELKSMKMKYTTDDMVQMAKDCGIKFIDKYKGIVKKHKWLCPKGHEWTATPNSIKNGSRCPKCSKSKPRKTIDEIKQIANQNGLVLLSNYFEGMKKNHLWECPNGHTWETTPERVKKGCQCIYCNRFLNEEKSRFILEQMTGREFPKNRTVLDGLELDGFCKELNLAFEYQGEQHYNRTHYFNTKGDFSQVIKNDRDKSNRCKKLGITKIDIPYTKAECLEEYLRKQIILNGHKIVNDSISWEKFKRMPHKLQELSTTAESRNGELLSTVYSGSHAKYTWRCLECSNTWEAAAKDIKRGSWCPTCANNQKYSMAEISKICENLGFEPNFKQYQGMNHYHSILCVNCRNPWTVRLNRIQQGASCPHCKNRR